MRLHSLSMTAVGPYVGTERIDFDSLAGDGAVPVHRPDRRR